MNPDFDAVRAECALPTAFPPDVLAAAALAAAEGPGPDRVDARDVELVTIDPPGSKDLDQAVGVARTASGFRVHYAIADLAAVVRPGGALDAEVRRRGQTVYLPDGSVPLHPPVLSEGASSLLPDGPRAAVLWTIDLDAAGEPTAVDVRRAVVHSRARLDYAGVQADVDAGRVHPAIAALPELGPLRRALAVRRGAIELELPEQEVVPDGAGGWTVQVRRRLPVEDWNAEISLLTGTCAARIMLDAGLGLLRTLPAPTPDALADFRRTARKLGFDWPAGATAAQVLAGLPLDTAPALALRRAAASLLRGAGYAAFGTEGPLAGPSSSTEGPLAGPNVSTEGPLAGPSVSTEGPGPGAPTPPPADPGHGGIGAPYAHVTAPLRRLVDRFGTEVCLAVTAGEEVPGWVREALPALPGLMAASDSLAAKVDRACIDRTEATLLASRVGEEFDVVVLRPGGEGDGAGEVYLPEPPVLAKCSGRVTAGATVRVRLTEADPSTGRISFVATG